MRKLNLTQYYLRYYQLDITIHIKQHLVTDLPLKPGLRVIRF